MIVKKINKVWRILCPLSSLKNNTGNTPSATHSRTCTTVNISHHYFIFFSEGRQRRRRQWKKWKNKNKHLLLWTESMYLLDKYDKISIPFQLITIRNMNYSSKESTMNADILSIFILHYNTIMLLDSLYYERSFSLTWVFSRSFSMPCASFSMLGGPDGTGSDEVRFPVHGGWDSRDVSMVGVCCQALKMMHLAPKSFC